MRPVSVAAGAGTTPFTQMFTGGGERAWKQPSGGSKTYYLYDAAGHVLCELNSAGSPLNTYAYGPGGLLERFQHTDSGVPYLVYLFDPSGNPVHRVRSVDPNTSSGAAVFVQDTALYDSQGLLHADIDTLTGGFNGGHLDPVGFQGQSGSYTDTETIHKAAGLYASLSGPGGVYYDPLSGVGMARSRADALNTYDQLLHPFDGWTFGAYAHEAGQFGIGESKGAVNFVAGSVVSLSPNLQIADAQVGGRLSEPIAATGTQATGDGFIQPVLIGVSFITGEGEVAAGGKAAQRLAGAIGESKVFSNILGGRINNTEAARLEQLLKDEAGVTVKYQSSAADKFGNHFDFEDSENKVIHLSGKRGSIRRGTMYEEVQHALDHKADPTLVSEYFFRNNNHLHAGTMRRLIENAHLPTSEAENGLLRAKAEEWEK